jgi:3-hydroxypropanoate dehydrogenase
MTAIDVLALPQDAQDLLFREARTANSFTDEPVTDEQLEAVYELIKWAPTSMNNQPLRVTFVRTDEARARLLPHLAEGNRKKTASAPVVAILTADTDFHQLLPKTFPHFPGAKDLFVEDEPRKTTAKLNASLQIGYFILGIRAAGLAAGPMTGFDAEGIRQEFFAGTAQEPLVVVNIGHIDESGTFPRNPRLDYDEFARTI